MGRWGGCRQRMYEKCSKQRKQAKRLGGKDKHAASENQQGWPLLSSVVALAAGSFTFIYFMCVPMCEHVCWGRSGVSFGCLFSGTIYSPCSLFLTQDCSEVWNALRKLDWLATELQESTCLSLSGTSLWVLDIDSCPSMCSKHFSKWAIFSDTPPHI